MSLRHRASYRLSILDPWPILSSKVVMLLYTVLGRANVFPRHASRIPPSISRRRITLVGALSLHPTKAVDSTTVESSHVARIMKFLAAMTSEPGISKIGHVATDVEFIQITYRSQRAHRGYQPIAKKKDSQRKAEFYV